MLATVDRRNPWDFRKLYQCPINQPSGGSALRRNHFRCLSLELHVRFSDPARRPFFVAIHSGEQKEIEQPSSLGRARWHAAEHYGLGGIERSVRHPAALGPASCVSERRIFRMRDVLVFAIGGVRVSCDSFVGIAMTIASTLNDVV